MKIPYFLINGKTYLSLDETLVEMRSRNIITIAPKIIKSQRKQTYVFVHDYYCSMGKEQLKKPLYYLIIRNSHENLMVEKMLLLRAIRNIKIRDTFKFKMFVNDIYNNNNELTQKVELLSDHNLHSSLIPFIKFNGRIIVSLKGFVKRLSENGLLKVNITTSDIIEDYLTNINIKYIKQMMYYSVLYRNIIIVPYENDEYDIFIDSEKLMRDMNLRIDPFCRGRKTKTVLEQILICINEDSKSSEQCNFIREVPLPFG